MDTLHELEQAEALLKPFAGEMSRGEANRVDVPLEVAQLKAAVKALVDAHWGYLGAIAGVDKPAPAEEGGPAANGHTEVIYIFFQGAAVAALRVLVPYEGGSVPTVCDLIPSATIYERELIELFGVTVTGTPTTEKLVLPDDWPDGVYPLRKSFTGFEAQQV